MWIVWVLTPTAQANCLADIVEVELDFRVVVGVNDMLPALVGQINVVPEAITLGSHLSLSHRYCLLIRRSQSHYLPGFLVKSPFGARFFDDEHGFGKSNHVSTAQFFNPQHIAR